MIPQEYQFMEHKTEDYRVEVFLHCLNSTRSKIKLITIKSSYMKTTQLIVRRIRIRSRAACESACRASPGPYDGP